MSLVLPIGRAAKWFLGLALATVAILTCMLIALHVFFHVAPFRGEPFSAARWQEVWNCGDLSTADCARHRASCPRGPMVTDLLTRHIAPGQTTRDDIRALLGPGDWAATIWHDDTRYDQCQMHQLGMCSGFAIDYDSVFICLGADGRVVAAGHRQH